MSTCRICSASPTASMRSSSLASDESALICHRLACWRVSSTPRSRFPFSLITWLMSRTSSAKFCTYFSIAPASRLRGGCRQSILSISGCRLCTYSRSECIESSSNCLASSSFFRHLSSFPSQNLPTMYFPTNLTLLSWLLTMSSASLQSCRG